MALRYSITDILNQWADLGVFAYVLPFLLIFAVVFALLEKTGVLSSDNKDNRGLHAIISGAIALLALQFDLVSTFFATIFPRFGVVLAIMVVVVVGISFAGGDYKWVGYVLAIATAVWAWTTWDDWSGVGGTWGLGEFFIENLSLLILLAGLVVIAIVLIKGAGKGPDKPKGG